MLSRKKVSEGNRSQKTSKVGISGDYTLVVGGRQHCGCHQTEGRQHCGHCGRWQAALWSLWLSPGWNLWRLHTCCRGSTALWFKHWPGDRRVPGSMPSSISCCCCCFLEQKTLLSLLQSTQLYKWENLSHRCCKEFGDLSRRSSTRFGETSLEERTTVKKGEGVVQCSRAPALTVMLHYTFE